MSKSTEAQRHQLGNTENQKDTNPHLSNERSNPNLDFEDQNRQSLETRINNKESDESQTDARSVSIGTTVTSNTDISRDDVCNRRVRRRLQRYETYDTFGDDDNDNDDNDADESSKGGEGTGDDRGNGNERSLLETWEQTGVMGEVVGSQSLLTQELELKRFNSFGSLFTGSSGKPLVKAESVADRNGDELKDSCEKSAVGTGKSGDAVLVSTNDTTTAIVASVPAPKKEFDDCSQETLVDENTKMDGCDDRYDDADSGDGGLNEKLMTNDILNNRILDSQIEEVDNDGNQHQAQTSRPKNFSDEQRQPSFSLSQFSQLSEVSLPFTPSQAMTSCDMMQASTSTMTACDMIIGAAEQIEKRDREDVTKPMAEDAQRSSDLQHSPRKFEKLHPSDVTSGDWATESCATSSTGLTPVLVKNERGMSNTNFKTSQATNDSSIKNIKIVKPITKIDGHTEKEQGKSKGNNDGGPIKKVTDEEIATIWNREDGSIITPPRLNISPSNKQHVNTKRIGSTSATKYTSLQMKYPCSVQEYNVKSSQNDNSNGTSTMVPTPARVSLSSTQMSPKLQPPLRTSTIPKSIGTTKKRPAPSQPSSNRLARKTKAEREAEKAMTNNIAKRAAELVSRFRVDRTVEKQLLLSMALTRENPRSAPDLYPGRGTFIRNGFYWGQYPPLEKVLRSHMEEYYELSITKCQSRAQQAFNNKLVALVKGEAEQYGWTFEKTDFDEKKIRDRIRCFFKTHIQNAKKRLKTMVRNPTKNANAKALVAHMDLINKHDEKAKESDQRILNQLHPLIANSCPNNGFSNSSIGKDESTRHSKEANISDPANPSSNNNPTTCHNRSLSLENEDCQTHVIEEKDHDARDAAQVLVLGFGRQSCN